MKPRTSPTQSANASADHHVEKVDISVVIPTFNRARLLETTIPALMQQQTASFSYEVIFVSNGSTDDTTAILKDAAALYPGKLRYFAIDPTGGPSAPRNVGIRSASAEVVIILDDDVFPEPDLVLEHARFHAQHPEPHDAALGEVYVPDHLLDDPMSFFHTFPYDEVRDRDRLSYMHFWTCNVSFKRQFMMTAGMFNERFLYYEDVECARRLADHGLHLKFLPSARGQHLHQFEPGGVPAKGTFIGRWLWTYLQKHPDPEMLHRHGVLSPSLGAMPFARRLLKRAGLYVMGNRLSLAALRTIGATRGRRSRLSDLYYYLLFRKHMLAGYRKARRECAAAPDIQPDNIDSDSEWVCRGES